MERLTKTYSDGTHGASDSLPCGENSYDYKNLLIEKLGKYEDLEEQGKLIKIPLEAYCIVDFEVRKGFVRYDDNSFKRHSGYLGISVFLTKSEAEAKLKGGENDSMES